MKSLGLLLVLVFLTAQYFTVFQFAGAQSYENIIISANGDVSPSNAPITKDGNVYTLTRDISGSLTIKKHDVTFDGAGYTLKGGSGLATITLEPAVPLYGEYIRNVIIKNVVITQHESASKTWGVLLRQAINCLVINNTVSNIEDGYGISVDLYSTGNTIAANKIDNIKGVGIWVWDHSNIILGNYITATQKGLTFSDATGNTVFGNHIADNQMGIYCWAGNPMPEGLTNLIYQNNFVNNLCSYQNQAVFKQEVPSELIYPAIVNVWNNGTLGNYWGDYTGVDANDDGVGDTPHIIDNHSNVETHDTDYYPLMAPVDISKFAPPMPQPSPSTSPTSSPQPSPVPTCIPAPTGPFDANAEFKSGMIPSGNVKFWYVWVNSSGTQLIYYAMLSDMYNPPIMSFLGQHFQTQTGTNVFVGNTKALIEVYEDKNGDGIPQADFTTGKSEILYHLVVNSSISYEINPLEKTVEEWVPHYRWGITYKTIEGFFFNADMSGFAFKAQIDYLRFEYDFFITQNGSYTKTTFAMSDLALVESEGAGVPVSLEGLSLSLLYITSTSSPKPYLTHVNGQPYDSATAEEVSTATLSGQIMVENEKAYEFLFDEDYTLTSGDVVEAFEVKSVAAAALSVPRYLTETRWVFGNLENVLNASILFPSATGPDGRINLDFGASNFLYRICYPVWGGKAIEHDPTGIAYFKPIFGFSDSSSGGISEDNQTFPHLWIVAAVVFVVFVSVCLLAYFVKLRNRGEKAGFQK